VEILKQINTTPKTDRGVLKMYRIVIASLFLSSSVFSVPHGKCKTSTVTQPSVYVAPVVAAQKQDQPAAQPQTQPAVPKTQPQHQPAAVLTSAAVYGNKGSQTIYGTIGKLGWCGWPLNADQKGMVTIAVGPKYISGVSTNSPTCGKCVCIKLEGTDLSRNQHPPDSAKPFYGTVIKGKIGDLCPECKDNHIDILTGDYYKSKVDLAVSKTVGVWAVDWGFVDCNSSC
jgi:hypothetical protein